LSKLVSLFTSCFNSFFSESREAKVSLFINFSAFDLSIQNSLAISFASSLSNFFLSKVHGFTLLFSIDILFFKKYISLFKGSTRRGGIRNNIFFYLFFFIFSNSVLAIFQYSHSKSNETVFLKYINALLVSHNFNSSFHLTKFTIGLFVFILSHLFIYSLAFG